MSWKNYLTPQQLRNFKRRARFTACGEPADVFSDRFLCNCTFYFVTVNRNTETGEALLEADGEEISPDYVSGVCRKVPEAHARRIIAHELYRWARMPEGTVSGYTPEQIAAEADALANG